MKRGPDYLLECFRTAHEELLARVKQRDDWIKIQLAAQVTLAALASGIEVLGAKGSVPVVWVAALALPVSLVICLLQSVEDRLIGHLAKYLAGFSVAQDARAGGEAPMLNFDASKEVKAFGRETLPFRTWALGLGFFVIPLAITIVPYAVRHPTGTLQWSVLSADTAITFGIVWVIIRNHAFRRKVALGDDAVRGEEA